MPFLSAETLTLHPADTLFDMVPELAPLHGLEWNAHASSDTDPDKDFIESLDEEQLFGIAQEAWSHHDSPFEIDNFHSGATSPSNEFPFSSNTSVTGLIVVHPSGHANRHRRVRWVW